jgi:deoxyribodipyrimidine photo-lyase
MQSLIDGDLANNNGGWQWSASTGTDACPYFRIFNPYSQSLKVRPCCQSKAIHCSLNVIVFVKFQADPSGDFIRHYVPELSSLKGPGKFHVLPFINSV